MRTDPFRVAGWCVVILAALVFLDQVRRMGEAPPVPETVTTATTATTAGTRSVAAAYVGNTNTHKFHRKSCRYASCPNCTAKFATREEALAAHYQPCGFCDP